jgi:hypothetical protein
MQYRFLTTEWTIKDARKEYDSVLVDGRKKINNGTSWFLYKGKEIIIS